MRRDPLILSIETATLGGAVALSRGEEVLVSVSGDGSASHSNTILREIALVLKKAGHNLSEVDFFAVATGPGSFTGLRIGIATVKGLSFSLQRPCVGVPTLEAVAYSAGICERVVSALPAGRGEVFVQMFAVSQDSVKPLDQPRHLSPERMVDKYEKFDQVCWCGEGVLVHHEKIRRAAELHQRRLTEESEPVGDSRGWRLVTHSKNLAESVSRLAFRRIQANDLKGADELKAIYVRPSDAEIKKQSTG